MPPGPSVPVPLGGGEAVSRADLESDLADVARPQRRRTPRSAPRCPRERFTLRRKLRLCPAREPAPSFRSPRGSLPAYGSLATASSAANICCNSLQSSSRGAGVSCRVLRRP
jgi:hypothetical protein